MLEPVGEDKITPLHKEKSKLQLIELSVNDERIFKIFYSWNINEADPERYTCRPVQRVSDNETYTSKTKTLIENNITLYYLMNTETLEVIGKVTFFDYNKRNFSGEFGYYIPAKHRNKGYGSIMISQFIETIFMDKPLNLYKLYATTASGNGASNKLLIKQNFTLDGRLRDHYWFDDELQDQLHYSLLQKEWKSKQRTY